MSVFETLYLLFKADTTDLKRGSDEAINSTKKLNESLEKIDTASDKIGKKFVGIATSFAGLIASLASIHSILSGIHNTVSYDINLGQQSKITGVSPEDLDAWSNAAIQAGGTAEGFQNSLKSLAEHFHTTAGVALKSFPQLADVLNKISRYAAFNYGKSMGLDEPTILLLRRTRRELEDLVKHQRDLGVVTTQDIEISRKFNNGLSDLTHSFRTLYNAIVIPVLPALTSLFETLTKGLGYLTDHKDLVVGAFVGIGAAALSAAVAFIPFSAQVFGLTIAVILLIALFALFWDDYNTYLKGGKSLTGEFKEEWKKLGKEVNDILDSWTDKIANFLDKFGIFKNLSQDLRNSKEERRKDEKILEGGGFLSDVNYKANKELSNFDLNNAKNLINSSANSPLNSTGNFYQSAFNRNSTINTGDIIINTQATDAEGIAAHIGLRWPDHFGQATNYYADNIHA